MAETHIESKIGTIKNNASEAYSFLSNFNNISAILPPGQVQDWESTEDTCSFTADKVGKISLRIIEREENKTIKIAGDQTPMDFTFWIQLKEVAAYDCRLRVTIKVKTNAMTKMMVKKPLKKFVDQLVDQLSMIPYQNVPRA